MTAGATGAAPPAADGAGAAAGGASTGGVAAMKAPALGTVGATGGVPAGVCGAPVSIACSVFAEKACPPGPVAWPVANPEANDCARLGCPPWPRPSPDGAIAVGAPCTPGTPDGTVPEAAENDGAPAGAGDAGAVGGAGAD